MDARSEIRSTLTRIRRRWFALVWLRVGAWAVAAIAVTLLAGVSLVRLADLRGGRLLIVAVATSAMAVGAALTIAWPWRRRPTDLQVARYIEERQPDLDDSLAAAAALIAP